MKKLLVALATLVVLASGIWLATGLEGDPGERSRPEAVTEPDEPETEEDPDPRTAASEILSLRARAVMEDDRGAFLSSIDPKAKRFRKQQRAIFDRLTSLRFGRYELEVQAGDGDLARREHRRRYKSADDVFIPRVEETYRFKGYDDADFVSNLFFTFVLRDGEWLVAADNDLKNRNRTERNLWDYGPVKQTHGKNVTLIQHPCREAGCLEIGDSFMQLAEGARSHVKQRWKGAWNGRVVVLVTSSRSEVRRIIDVDYAISNFAAFSYSPFQEDTGYSPARIVVDRATLAASSPNLELLLTHEIAHVATRRVSGPHIPLWVEEGLAEWMARSPGDTADLYFANQVAVGATEPRLATDREFRRGSAEELFLHYQASRTAVAYFIERWGYNKFLRFYKSLGDSHDESGGRAKHLRSAVRRFTGLTPGQFERQWADSI
ncbi:MAG: hypothetical protein ACRDJT_10365 [Actinomycetota bacterium]